MFEYILIILVLIFGAISFYFVYDRFFMTPEKKTSAIYVAALKDFWVVTAIGLCVAPLYAVRFSPLLSVLICCGTSALYLGILLRLRLVSWKDARRILQAFRSKGTTS